MGDWSSYSLSDFLLFSPQVYERLFVLHNQDLWPAQLVSLALAAAVLMLVLRRTPSGTRTAFVILGAAWIVVAVAFFLGRYQTINWLGAYISLLAAFEGAVLILLGLAGRTALVDPQGNRLGCAAGIAVLASGLLIYPLLAPAFGYNIAGAKVFGLTPDPTAVATLGAVALLNSRLRFLAALIPALWCVFTALTLWTLGRADFLVAPGLMAVALLIMAWPRPPTPRQTSALPSGPNPGP